MLNPQRIYKGVVIQQRSPQSGRSPGALEQEPSLRLHLSRWHLSPDCHSPNMICPIDCIPLKMILVLPTCHDNSSSLVRLIFYQQSLRQERELMLCPLLPRVSAMKEAVSNLQKDLIASARESLLLTVLTHQGESTASMCDHDSFPFNTSKTSQVAFDASLALSPSLLDTALFPFETREPSEMIASSARPRVYHAAPREDLSPSCCPVIPNSIRSLPNLALSLFETREPSPEMFASPTRSQILCEVPREDSHPICFPSVVIDSPLTELVASPSQQPKLAQARLPSFQSILQLDLGPSVL